MQDTLKVRLLPLPPPLPEEFWPWIFEGEARAAFDQLPPAKKLAAVRATLRLHTGALACVCILEKNVEFVSRSSMGTRYTTASKWLADVVIDLATGKVLKDRTGKYYKWEPPPSVTFSNLVLNDR